jgi:transcriptional regulator with XRE-family HTH domain
MFKEDFSLRLSLLRTQMNISARDMSLSLGQNPGYINSIENGKSLLSMAMFFYICEYLHVSPEEFFNTSNAYPTKIKKIVGDLSPLDDETLTAVETIIEKLTKKI